MTSHQLPVTSCQSPATRLLLFFLPLLLLATFLRFYRLDQQSFWNDEGNSARLAERSVQLIVEGAAGDIHPPGYYLALKAWRGLLGESEWALRALSAFAGVIAVSLIIRLGKELFDRPAAWYAAGFAGLFAAAHPFLIYYSQETRMYMSLTALACASFLLTVLHLRDADKRVLSQIQPRDQRLSASICVQYCLPAGIVLVSTAGLYTHYAFPFVLLAENLYVAAHLVLRRLRLPLPRRKYMMGERAGAWEWLGIQVVTLLLFLPWLPTAVRQITTWPSTQEAPALPEALNGIWRWLTYGPHHRFMVVVPALFACALLILLGLLRASRARSPAPLPSGSPPPPFFLLPSSLLAPLIWLALPAALVLALGLFSEAFAKFLIVAVPPLCLLLGNGATTLLPSSSFLLPPSFFLLPSSLRKPTAALLALLITLGSAQVLIHQYFDPATFRDDYRGMARRIATDPRPGDAVILNAPNQWEVFTYYHRAGAPVYPLPRTRPLNLEETLAALETIARDHTRLFTLYWGDQQADPDRVIESWLNARTFRVSEEWIGQVRFAVYAVPPDSSDFPTRRLDATFADNLHLEQVATPTEISLHPGDVLALTLFWSLERPDPQPYKVFLHLTANPTRPPAAQQDSEPDGGLSPTSAWLPGQTYPDNHGLLLPPDLSAGEYQLLVGLYNPADGQRLPLTAGGEGDTLLLQTIVVAP